MSELFLGLFIIGITTGLIVAMAVALGRKEDREARSKRDVQETLRRAG